MGTPKEYNMAFTLNAKLGNTFGPSFAKAQKELAVMQNELQTLNKTQGDISAYQKQQSALEATKAKLASLQQQYDNIQKEIGETGTFSATLENKLLSKQLQLDKTSASIAAQTTQLDQMGEALRGAGINTDNLTGENEKLGKQIDEVKTKQEEAAEAAEGFGESGVAAFSMLEQAIAAAGVAKALKEIYDYLADCTDASMDFESAMTGVAKTTDMTDAELAAMSEAIKDLSTVIPVITDDLAGVGEVAGQLGIAKENLLDFSVVMSMLSTATSSSCGVSADIRR